MTQEFDSVSVFINQEWKQDGKIAEKSLTNTINLSGRWSTQQWNSYVVYSFKQICKEKKNHQSLNSFNQNRRNYTSFDRRFVQFLKAQYDIEQMSVELQKKLIKRAKSKFNTLKRSYKQKSKETCKKIIDIPDFEEMMYRQAKKIEKNTVNNQIKHLIEEFENLRLEQLVMNDFQHSDTSVQRPLKPLYVIKTRSFANKQKQIGTNQN